MCRLQMNLNGTIWMMRLYSADDGIKIGRSRIDDRSYRNNPREK